MKTYYDILGSYTNRIWSEASQLVPLVPPTNLGETSILLVSYLQVLANVAQSFVFSDLIKINILTDRVIEHIYALIQA